MSDAYLFWGRKARPGYADMLWPVDVWSVQVPLHVRRPNVFQEAILGLLHAGVQDMEELARLLGMEKQLVAFILAKELQPSGWIDQRFRVTSVGLELLRGAVPDEQDVQIAYVFRDAISGDWLPHLVTELPEVFASEQLSGRPSFVLDRNTGRRQQPFVLQKTQGLPAIDKDTLLTALMKFERRRAQDRDDDELGEIDLSSLEFLSEVPQQAYLWTQVYKAEGDLYPWLVADPWGIQSAMRDMRVTLEGVVERHQHLRDWLDRRFSLSDSGLGDVDAQARRLLAAEIRLGDLLPLLSAGGHTNLNEHLLRLLRLESRIKEDPAARGEDLSAAAVESGNVLEALLQWMLLRWPADTSTWPSYWDRKTLHAWLSELPLNEPLNSACVGALESQPAKAVQQAVFRRNQPMKALLVAALLSVHEHKAHPLREIPCTPLDWRLIGLRNKGGHASGVRLIKDDVLALIDMSISWCAKFHPHF